jgi:hypothetical protein
LEENRIFNAAAGIVLIVFLSVSVAGAQEAEGDSVRNIGEPADSLIDTSGVVTHADSVEEVTEGIFEKEKADSVAKFPEPSEVQSLPDTSDTLHLETINPTFYYRRDFLSRGVGDELKREPDIYVLSPGPTGSPQIPLLYLNVPGIEMYLNKHPFLYNDIYRPYIIGSDLNAIPWEILNDIYWNDERSLDNRIHFDLGRPPDNSNRSDVEIARGPYGYNSSRWRFFRPFGAKTYGYFTVGFKKANGYLLNTDYNGYHVTGGGSHKIFNGLLEFDVWKYRAKAGLNTFEFLTPQVFRHSRTTLRYETSYRRKMGNYFDLNISGMYQKNGLIAKGFIDTLAVDSDIGGGRLSLGKNVAKGNLDLGMSIYRLRLFKLAGVEPSVKQFEYFGNISGELDNIDYRLNMIYSWNSIDHGTALPSAYVGFDLSSEFKPFVTVSRSRRLPDLHLMYYNNTVDLLGVPGLLESYSFETTPNLRSPVTSKAGGGIEGDLGWLKCRVAASYMQIDDQIYLSYQSDTLSNVTVTPVNFDDELMEVTGTVNFRRGIFDGELGGSYKQWKERYFSDGLEKGPAFIGFGRLSALKSFFFDDLFLGGSLEFRATSRQDYRSVQVAYLNGDGVLNGRFEFKYKDFIFWWNEDNLTNNSYTTWWPYPQRPRTLWWGFRWRFYD